MNHDLEQRLNALQREHARTRRQLRVVIALAICGLALATLPPSIIQAEAPTPMAGELRGTSLIIEDDLGRPRARIGALADGHFGFAMMLPDGKVMTQYILAKGDCPMLQMFDEDGKRRASLDVVRKIASLDLLTADEESPLGIRAFVEEGNTGLALDGALGEISLVIGNRGPWLTMKDHNHTTRAALNLDAKSGIPILGMNDNKGSLRAVMGEFQEGDKPFGFGVLDDDRMHSWPTRTPAANP